ncbi:hypothetical protein KKG56_09020, partial [bacterium]|nr:hypothetical protein [bacterium]
ALGGQADGGSQSSICLCPRESLSTPSELEPISREYPDLSISYLACYFHGLLGSSPTANCGAATPGFGRKAIF